MKKQRLYDRIVDEYHRYDQELNSEFFKIPVPAGMTYAELLDEYQDIQLECNGDAVIFLTDVHTKSILSREIVSATPENWVESLEPLRKSVIPEEMTVDEALHFIGKVLRIYRVVNMYYSSDGESICGGEIVDFLN